jgi:hypothetical protein
MSPAVARAPHDGLSLAHATPNSSHPLLFTGGGGGLGFSPGRRRTQGEGGARRGLYGGRALGFGEHGRSGCGAGRGAPIQTRQLGEGRRQERVRVAARRGLPPARLRHGEEGEQLRLTGGSRR